MPSAMVALSVAVALRFESLPVYPLKKSCCKIVSGNVAHPLPCSVVVVAETHQRTISTDLLLGVLKKVRNALLCHIGATSPCWHCLAISCRNTNHHRAFRQPPFIHELSNRKNARTDAQRGLTCAGAASEAGPACGHPYHPSDCPRPTILFCCPHNGSIETAASGQRWKHLSSLAAARHTVSNAAPPAPCAGDREVVSQCYSSTAPHSVVPA